MTTFRALSVPIDVKGLIVSAADVNAGQDKFHAKFAALDYPFDQLASGDGTDALDPVFSIDILPPALENLPRSSTDGSNLDAGVHLHWALPDALVKGRTTGAQKVSFPAVPNRWLVVRTILDTNGQPTARQGWVVESDYLWSSATQEANDPQQRRNAVSPYVIDRAAFDAGGGKPYAFRQGRVYDLKGWSETVSSPRTPEVNATGFGLPEFSAVYAHSRNVFGFWDDAQELGDRNATGALTLSYAVVGWFSDPARDPLATVPAKDARTFLAALKTTFGWTVALDATDALPTRTVCQGFLAQVSWNPQQGEMIPVRTADQPMVALGNTTAQAMAAFVVHQMSPSPADPAALESLLDALQIGLTGNATDLSVCSQWDERRHQAQFQPHQGGTVWQMVPRSAPGPSTGSVGSATLTQAATTPLSALPASVSEALNALNGEQAEVDRLTRDLESLRSQQFSDWHKVMQSIYHDPVTWNFPTCTPPTSMGYVAWVKTQVLDRMVNAHTLAVEMVARHRNTLLTLAPAYDIKAVNADPFWEAHDPVIVLNPGIAPSLRHGGDGRFRDDGLLLCRLDTQTITTLSAAGSSVALPVSALPLPVAAPTDAPFLQPFLDESPWFDPNAAPGFAQRLKALAPSGNTLPDLPTLNTQIQAAQALFYKPQITGSATGRGSAASMPVPAPDVQPAGQDAPSGTMPPSVSDHGTSPIIWGGHPPSPVGQEQWSQPFLPYGVQWEISYWPDRWVSNPANVEPDTVAGDPYPTTYDAYGSDFIAQNFEVDPGDTELKFTGNDGFDPTTITPLVFRGSTTLGTRPDVQFKTRLAAYLQRYKDPTPDGALTRALTSPVSVVSQTARGFNQWLLARQQELQVDLGNPLTLPEGVPGLDPATMNAFLGLAREAVGDQRSLAPLPQQTVLNGLRSGYLQLTRARVVDAFGQTMDYSATGTTVTTVYSRAWTAVASGVQNGPCVHIAPRVTQPSRVKLNWISARDGSLESNNLPLESPLFGWVLYNRIDDTLMVYTASGLLYGTLRNDAPFWGAAADSIWTPAPLLGEVQVHPDLVRFCDGVAHPPVQDPTRKPVDYLASLLDCIDRAGQTFVSPRLSQDGNRAVLMSRPMALVKVNVGLDLKGLPAVDQGMPDFVVQLGLPPTSDLLQHRFTGGFEQVRFPLEIGDASDPDDSVVGFFVHPDPAGTPGDPKDYQTFYSAFARPNAVGVETCTTVNATLTQAPQTLTVLMDPRGSLGVSAFVLPTQTLTIPTGHYVDAMAGIRMTLNAFPLLAPLAQPAAPVPQVAGEDWTFVQAGRPWTQTPIKPSPNEAAVYPLGLAEGWLRTAATSSASVPGAPSSKESA